MSNANYYLKEPLSKEKTLIYLYFSYDAKRLKYSVGELVMPKFWNEKEQRVKKSMPGSMELNGLLNRIEEEVNKIYRQAKTFGTSLSNEYFKEKLDKVLYPTGKASKDLFDYFNNYLEAQNDVNSAGTIRKARTVFNHLKQFQSKKHFSVSFDKIDARFFELIRAYYINDVELTNNTIAKNIKIFKSFMKWATERGYNSNLAYTKVKAQEKDADLVYLTENELFTLSNLNLSYYPMLEKVRDSFAFSCFTGLRFSDLVRVSKESVKNDEIHLITEKTTDRIIVPLNKFALQLLNKYNYSLPLLSNQKTNEHIKKIGLLAKIEEPVTLTKFRGAKEIKETKPKYAFIGTHTARRTFITLSLEKGMRPEVVMSIVGTKDYKTFRKYIKITDKVQLVEMKRIWDKEPVLKVV